MGLKEQYLKELNSIKDERKERVIEAAKIEFGKFGITNTKLSKISARAKIGEASLYRYFNNKYELAIHVANSYWNDTNKIFNEVFVKKMNKEKTGLDKIRVYLSIFVEFYTNHKDFLKYMNDFDMFMMSANSEYKNLIFDQHIIEVREAFAALIRAGQSDGSIRKNIDGYQKYSFPGQVMVGLVTKLSLRVGYLPSETHINHIAVIEDTIEMFISYVKV
ncbi:MAG: TetR/AcrR family transcriptional regulator [Candidatus Izemoplasma sp.]